MRVADPSRKEGEEGRGTFCTHLHARGGKEGKDTLFSFAAR